MVSGGRWNGKLRKGTSRLGIGTIRAFVGAMYGSAWDISCSKWLDLEMLALPGGGERTRKEWDSLFSRACFEITKAIPTAFSKSGIEARLRG